MNWIVHLHHNQIYHSEMMSPFLRTYECLETTIYKEERSIVQGLYDNNDSNNDDNNNDNDDNNNNNNNNNDIIFTLSEKSLTICLILLQKSSLVLLKTLSTMSFALAPSFSSFSSQL